MVDVEALRKDFLDLEFDQTGFELAASQSIAVAKAYGETRPEFIEADHPDLQACLPVVASLVSGRKMPIDFPKLGGISMDGGKAVEIFAPVPLDTKLTGKTHLHDIYDKSGRSGQMVFLVSRMEIYDDAGNHLANADSRQVIREMPDS